MQPILQVFASKSDDCPEHLNAGGGGEDLIALIVKKKKSRGSSLCRTVRFLWSFNFFLYILTEPRVSRCRYFIDGC